MQERLEAALLCRVRGLLCALPLEHVEETMRPLEVEPIGGVPAFVCGLSVIRASAVPVINVAMLVGGELSQPTRFVTVKAGQRRIALAVDAVIGIRAMPPGALDGLPLLLHRPDTDAIAAVGTLDSELLLVLRSARLVPEGTWAAIDAGGSA
jgi:purine-binding chemotaxis protein CheW